MRMIDLFSGIGGFHYAAEQVWDDVECLVHCEIDPFCQKILKKHWPEVPIEPDIYKLDGTKYADVDLLTGGFPCQPFSYAGKKLGTNDERYLWPEMLRTIAEAKPRYVIGENVGNSINMLADEIGDSLGNIGYKLWEIYDIESDSFGAPTMERHVWYIATPNGDGLQRRSERSFSRFKKDIWKFQRSHSTESHGWDIGESKFRRVGERVSGRLDSYHRKRLKALGNAIIPKVAVQIMRAIKASE